MTSKETYIESLKWRLKSLNQEIAKLQHDIQELFNEVDVKQGQAQNLALLLKAEGLSSNDPSLANLSDLAIADVAYEILISKDGKAAVHYQDITGEVLARGIRIPGKNPASNLLSHINRDKRFVRTARGTYALKEWGLKEMPARKSKRARKKIRGGG